LDRWTGLVGRLLVIKLGTDDTRPESSCNREEQERSDHRPTAPP